MTIDSTSNNYMTMNKQRDKCTQNKYELVVN